MAREYRLADEREVDEAARGVGAKELHGNPIADLHSLESLYDPSLGSRPQRPHPRSLVRRPRYDGIEPPPDVRGEQLRRRGLAHLPLDLRRVALLERAVCRQRLQLLLGVGRRRARE